MVPLVHEKKQKLPTILAWVNSRWPCLPRELTYASVKPSVS